FPAGYSLAGRSPAEPASASPTAAKYASILRRRSISFLRSAYSLTKNIGSESTLANLFFCPADGVHFTTTGEFFARYEFEFLAEQWMEWVSYPEMFVRTVNMRCSR